MLISDGDIYYYKDEDGKQCRVRIETDDNTESPREWDHLCKMACFHSRYDLGDKHEFDGDCEDFLTKLCQKYMSKKQIESLVDKYMEKVHIEPPKGEMPDLDATVKRNNEIYSKYTQLINKAKELELFQEARALNQRVTVLIRQNTETYAREKQLATEFTVEGDVMYGEHGYKGTKEKCEKYIEELRESLLDGDIFLGATQMYKDVCKELDETEIFMRPLYLYDHSGLAISMGGFNDTWDSGQIGWIYCTKEKAEKEMCKKEQPWREYIYEIMQGEVKEYDYYLHNEVYWCCAEEYDGENDEWNETDSSGGFIGDKIEKNGILDMLGVKSVDDLHISIDDTKTA